MAVDVVEIVLKLQQLRQFQSGTSQASKSIAGVGTAAEKSGKKARSGWKGMAKWAGGASALYAAQRVIRGSVDATEDLGKATLAVHRASGLDVQTSSQWAAVAQSRNMSTKQLQVAFVKLGKETEKARVGTGAEAKQMADLRHQYLLTAEAGGKKSPAALAKLSRAMDAVKGKGEKARATMKLLGVSQAAIARGDTKAVLNQVADGLSKMKNAAQRATITQQLFGRGGQALLPILMKGRKGLQEQLDVVKKYGDYLDVHSVKQLQGLAAEEREQKIAWKGMQVQLGKALLPILMKVSKVISQVTFYLSKNQGVVRYVVYAVGALVSALMVLKYTMIAVNIVMDANPVGAIIAGIVLLTAAIIIAWKRSATFRNIIYSVWDTLKRAFFWAKKNWPLMAGILLGPVALAAAEIIHHFGAIKKFVQGVVNAVKRMFDDLVKYVKAIPGKLAGTLTSLASKVPGGGAFLSGVGAVGGAASSLFGGAAGGVVPHRSPVLVGEHGPELLSLPARAQVTPLPGGGGAGAHGATVVVPLYLDGREVARAVARVTADKMARR